jgi:hypothetical protein
MHVAPHSIFENCNRRNESCKNCNRRNESCKNCNRRNESCKKFQLEILIFCPSFSVKSFNIKLL